MLLPRIAIATGDPAGIGPEVIAKAVASRALRKVCRSIVIGSFPVMEQATKALKLKLKAVRVDDHEMTPIREGTVAVLDPLETPLGKFTPGVAATETGAASVVFIRKAVELAQIGSRNGAPQGLFMIAEGLRRIGRHDDALGALGLGVAQAEQQGEHYYDAELHRLRAEILLDTDGNAVKEAEALFHQALEIAQRQEAKTFELRAATSLARLWQRQGKRDAARALLAPLYAWFTEGFATRDLQDAKALLEDLG